MSKSVKSPVGKKLKILALLVVVLVLGIILWVVLSGIETDQTKADSIEDVIQKPVGMMLGSIYAEIAKEEGYFDENTEILEYNTEIDAVEALRSGKVGCAITSSLYSEEYVSNFDDIMVFPESIGSTDYAFGFQKGSLLCNEFNAAMKELKAEGIEEMLTQKWLTGNATSQERVKIKDGTKGTLRYWVNTGSPPMAFVSEGGEYVGYAVDMVLLVAERMGYNVEITECSFSGLIPALVSDTADIVGRSMAVTEERKKSIDFSDSFVSADVQLIVLKSDVSEELVPEDTAESDKSIFATIKEGIVNTFIKEKRWKMFVDGIATTILITVLSAAFGTLLGLAMYILFRQDISVINSIMLTLNRWLTGVPVVVLLMLMYYVVFNKTILDGKGVAIVTFMIIFAIGTFGLLKTGAEAVGIGQVEAATDLGFTRFQTVVHIVLPQSILHVMPLYRSKLVDHLKATAIVGYIAVLDLTKTSDLIRSRTFDAFFPLIVTAIIYYLLGWGLDSLMQIAERKMKPGNRHNKLLKGVEEK